MVRQVLITEEVTIKWSARTRKHYEDKGYVFTKTGDKFNVNAGDLTDCSSALVNVQCDGCGTLMSGVFVEYKRRQKGDGKNFCTKCALAGRVKWVSLYEWLCANLSEEKSNGILSRWDYDLNIKNSMKLSPKDVGHASAGINGKGYWFKCLDHPEHKPEQKNINSLTGGSQSSIDCHQCNSIAIVRPDLVQFLVNNEDAYLNSIGMTVKIPMKCPNCGYEKEMSPNHLVHLNGVSCPRCSDGVSYPEKFIFNALEQLGIMFNVQLGRNTFEWCGNLKYDFYIPKLNCIIETHGLQHYRDSTGGWKRTSLSKIQSNDIHKELLAKKNGITHYIVLDCRESKMQWIKNGIMKSNLRKLLKIEESSVDWEKCNGEAFSSIVKKVCDLWSGGIKSVSSIVRATKLGTCTVGRYLKKGAVIGWCDYDPKLEIKNNYKTRSKRVICLTTNQAFNSQTEAGRVYNVDPNTIGRCCSGKRFYKTAGKHPITGECLTWKYCG